ncbi:MAG TPA: hypothetical protein VH023_13780 [Rhodopila sp.]|jgi:hypothetical protein|nr:hypothetical protein [Rhodopila sp.]
MADRSADPAGGASYALRHALHEANDHKIRRITAMLDDVADPAGKQAILDPLRGRLGALRPVRPLRFVRLLFTPFDPLIVPPNAWRPNDVTVPRNALAPLSAVVRAGLGAEALVIDGIIAGHKADAVATVAAVGETLWPRAADILATSAVPAEWGDSGLRPALYQPLAGAVAAVLRRASGLLALARDTEVGALAVDRATIEAILHGLGDEPAQGGAMVVALILRQAPRAIPVLRQCVSSVSNRTSQRAMALGVDQVVTGLDGPSGIVETISRAPLAVAGEDVRRIVAFLAEMDDDAGSVRHRPRLKAIRDQVDKACRKRFAEALADGLMQPLAAAGAALDGSGQTLLESRARNLRTLETAARSLGGGATYDQQLRQAAETVRMAAKAGTLTPVRMLRLMEILAGSEAAAALYRQPPA